MQPTVLQQLHDSTSLLLLADNSNFLSCRTCCQSRLCLSADFTKLMETRIIPRTGDPVWNEAHTVAVAHDVKELLFLVKDHDRLSTEHVAKVSLTLSLTLTPSLTQPHISVSVSASVSASLAIILPHSHSQSQPQPQRPSQSQLQFGVSSTFYQQPCYVLQAFSNQSFDLVTCKYPLLSNELCTWVIWLLHLKVN